MIASPEIASPKAALTDDRTVPEVPACAHAAEADDAGATPRARAQRVASPGVAAVGITAPSPRPPLVLETWPLDRLVPYARNARTHSDAQVAEIAGSIRSFGFVNPILVSDAGDIIAGHGRLAAARQLGLASVPVIVLCGLSDTERRQLVLADNRIALNAGWDLDMLRLELQDLAALGTDLLALGFSEGELRDALTLETRSGLTDEDAVPDLPSEAVTVPGDLWLLGNHRLLCGDSTKGEDVARLLGTDVPQLMVTDPPYGVAYDPAWRHRAGVNASTRLGKVSNDDRADWREAWALFPGNIAYVWHGALHTLTVAESLIATGFNLRTQIIWAKERLVLGRGDYHWQHEPCWYAVRSKGHWTGDRKQTSLWSISAKDQDTDTVHGTQKPVECMRRPMRNNSEPGAFVYDPFLGSGTSLIAAETIGRRCLGLEIDPVYADVIIKRFEDFSGIPAIHAATGKTFAEIADERGVTLGVRGPTNGAADTAPACEPLES